MRRAGAGCLRGGEAEDTRLARAFLLLTSSREWEGNEVSHNARKDVKLTADAAVRILILISQRWQVSPDSVMRQLQPIKQGGFDLNQMI